MTLHLYAHRLSQPSRAAEILLRELDMPYSWHEVDFANGETREPWFADEVNALKTIPALVIEDESTGNPTATSIGESHAVMRYLCRVAPDRELASRWYPTEALQLAPVDTWMAWHHNNVRAYDMFHDIMNLHLTLPMLKYELQASALKPLQEGLCGSLATLDAQLAQHAAGEPTLCGGPHPTLADLTLACELYQIVAVGYRFTGFAHVAAWLDHMARRPHFSDVSQEIVEQGREIREQSGAYLDLDGAFS
ncbi:glutathione S-transferase family protein [Salinisphaera sp.]|uniref:glutathione S-transferase family protein n=1 Tax=Salinisphaera sp. TaxID=1914330 RepID=UPI000C55844A|nr:glutathione S-transferase family protein [Salinisphaera sp.]MBS63797.1 glutathione S-transferase [Salinisphaera sp.]